MNRQSNPVSRTTIEHLDLASACAHRLTINDLLFQNDPDLNNSVMPQVCKIACMKPRDNGHKKFFPVSVP